jgi:hypothetical protein
LAQIVDDRLGLGRKHWHNQRRASGSSCAPGVGAITPKTCPQTGVFLNGDKHLLWLVQGCELVLYDKWQQPEGVGMRHNLASPDGTTARSMAPTAARSTRSACRGEQPPGGSQSPRAPSPQAFRDAVYAKGWTLKALAERWGYTLPWLCKVIDKGAARPQQTNDALRGLPRRGRPLKVPARWRGQESDQQDLPRPRVPGLRYAGYMVLGAVVAATKAVGSMCEEGGRGVVVEIIGRPARALAERQQDYRVIFESGDVEVFTPDLVDEYLVTTGLEREAVAGYRYVDEATLARDHARGLFEF